MTTPVLKVTDLRTHYYSAGGTQVSKAVDGISFALEAGRSLGIVGESGSGKTTVSQSLVRLLPANGRIVGGSIEFEGRDLMPLSQSEMRRIRGKGIATIMQDPMASLDPLFSIYDQVADPVRQHASLSGRTLTDRVIELLKSVRIPSVERRMKDFPHQLSGGMRQRVVGAIAQAGAPRVIIADEPTTNLDVTIQLQYLSILKDLQNRTGVALIFITHDMGIVAKMCDTVAVMYAGRFVEYGPIRDLFTAPKHPYTKMLLRSIPVIGSKERLVTIPGQPPNLAQLPPGCAFQPRCPSVEARCSIDQPSETRLSDDRVVRCHIYDGEKIDG